MRPLRKPDRKATRTWNVVYRGPVQIGSMLPGEVCMVEGRYFMPVESWPVGAAHESPGVRWMHCVGAASGKWHWTGARIQLRANESGHLVEIEFD